MAGPATGMNPLICVQELLMSNDYREEKRSNQEIRGLAKATRLFFGVDGQSYVDIVACISSGEVKTVAGLKRLAFDIVSDGEMRGRDGVTLSDDQEITMRFKASVWESAIKGNRRSRMTLAHELGHAVLNHSRAAMGRETGVNFSTMMPSFILPYESAEHMANEFASYFLIGEELVKSCSTSDEISSQFGVSAKAAEVRYKRIMASRPKIEISYGFAKLIGELNGDKRKNIAPKNPSVENYDTNDDAHKHNVGPSLPVCEIGNLTPVGGNKYKRRDSGIIGDRLQDGDPFDG
jgi:hypothetical protein